MLLYLLCGRMCMQQGIALTFLIKYCSVESWSFLRGVAMLMSKLF